MTASGPGIWRDAWRALTARPEELLAPVLAAGVGWVTAQVLVQWVLDDAVARTRPCTRRIGGLVDLTRCPAGDGAATTATVLGTFAFCVFGLLFWTVVLRTVLGARSLPLRRVAGPVLVLVVVLGGLLTVGVGLGVVPGLVIGFLGQFALLGVLLEGRGPLAALRDSARLVLRAPLAAAAFSSVAVLVLAGGAVLFVVGLWPAAVLIALAQVRFRDLSPLVRPAGV